MFPPQFRLLISGELVGDESGDVLAEEGLDVGGQRLVLLQHLWRVTLHLKFSILNLVLNKPIKSVRYKRTRLGPRYQEATEVVS